jgi:hypothetical protein
VELFYINKFLNSNFSRLHFSSDITNSNYTLLKLKTNL